ELWHILILAVANHERHPPLRLRRGRARHEEQQECDHTDTVGKFPKPTHAVCPSLAWPRAASGGPAPRALGSPWPLAPSPWRLPDHGPTGSPHGAYAVIPPWCRRTMPTQALATPPPTSERHVDAHKV